MAARCQTPPFSAFAASALPRLGLPEDSVATFPPAFLDGMAAPWRLRALGDVGGNAPKYWWWGGPDHDRVDGVLVLYAKEESELRTLIRRFDREPQKTWAR